MDQLYWFTKYVYGFELQPRLANIFAKQLRPWYGESNDLIIPKAQGISSLAKKPNTTVE